MITGDLKNKIDRVWDAFWSGGISNPLEVIEQITYLMFIRRLDDVQTRKERVAKRTDKPIEGPLYTAETEELRWSRFSGLGSPEAMLETVRDRVFPWLRQLGGEDSTYSNHMRDARFTTVDLRWFEDAFVEFGFGTHQDIELVATEHGGLGVYLRSLTGLDREAASAALDQVQEGRTLNAGQLRFLAMLTDVLARNGIVDVGRLYEAPFTALASGGPEDLFAEADVDAIVAVLRDVRSTAIPVAEAV